MATMETEGALVRRLAVALSVAALLVCGFFVWLKLARGVAYIGPVPTSAFWILPSFAGLWLAIWPQRRKASRHVRVLALATAVVLVVVVGLSVLHSANLE